MKRAFTVSPEDPRLNQRRNIDWPIPLTDGVLAWLRTPWPLTEDEVNRIERALEAALHFIVEAGFVEGMGPNEGAEGPAMPEGSGRPDRKD